MTTAPPPNGMGGYGVGSGPPPPHHRGEGSIYSIHCIYNIHHIHNIHNKHLLLHYIHYIHHHKPPPPHHSGGGVYIQYIYICIYVAYTVYTRYTIYTLNTIIYIYTYIIKLIKAAEMKLHHNCFTKSALRLNSFFTWLPPKSRPPGHRRICLQGSTKWLEPSPPLPRAFEPFPGLQWKKQG